MASHEFLQFDEMSNQGVFDIFDRASLSLHNTSMTYLLGDGIAIKVGWIDSTNSQIPDLSVTAHDMEQKVNVPITVDEQTAHYTRYTHPGLSSCRWLFDDQKRYIAGEEKVMRCQSFLVPTVTLEPIALAIVHTEPYIERFVAPQRMRDDQIKTNPLATTDIQAIKDLIREFSAPLGEEEG